MLARLRRLLCAAPLLAAPLACGTDAPIPNEPAPARAAAAAAAEPSSEPDCEVTVEGPGEAALGQENQARVSLRPTGSFEVNQEAPLKVSVASTTLELPRERYGLDDASVLAPGEVTMSIPFTANSPGEHSLEVHAHFGLCDGEACALCRKKAALTTVVN